MKRALLKTIKIVMISIPVSFMVYKLLKYAIIIIIILLLYIIYLIFMQ